VALDTDKPAILTAPTPLVVPSTQPSRAKLAIAFAVAAVSDVASFFTEFAPPIQWGIDVLQQYSSLYDPGTAMGLLPG